MKELIVISGKGGTGKTSMVAAFASLSKDLILCDTDVDAADLHLIMNPKIQEQHLFKSGNTALLNIDKCVQCGICRDLCKFDAISEDYKINSFACEGCGVCFYFCPEKAIDFPENICGDWYISKINQGLMVHARLGVGEENSGKLVTLVRKEARNIGQDKGYNFILTDGPPGVGCPVIASIGGANAVLIISEPTVSGKHDTERVINLAKHFNVFAMVCVNKYDLNKEMSQEIQDFVSQKNIPYVGNIPFDPAFTKSMVNGQNIFDYNPDLPSCNAVKEIWNNVSKILSSNTT